MSYLAAVLAFWIISSLMKPKRDWYLVETRMCTDENLAIEVFLGQFCAKFAYDKSMSQSKTVGKHFQNDFVHKENGEFRHKNGAMVYVWQMVFRDAPAAIAYYDRVKDELPSFFGCQKAYIWRVESRFKSRVDVFLSLSPFYDATLIRATLPRFTLLSQWPDKGWIRYFDEEEPKKYSGWSGSRPK